MLGLRRIVLTTPLAVSDVCAAIGAETQRARIPSRPAKSFFEGCVSDDGFELNRPGPFGKGIGPVVTGRITSGDDGTTVKATIRVNLYGLVLFSLLVAIATVSLIAGDSGGFIAAFVLLLSIAAYAVDAGRCEQRLRTALGVAEA